MESPAFGTLPSRLKRIGGMATMPSREDSLRQALPSILPQLDRLYLYLDGHSDIPEWVARDSRIVPILAKSQEVSLHASGKFIGLVLTPEPCLYFCFDDDIHYPERYVSHMAAALRRHAYRALVGIHGAVYRLPCRSYVRDRRVFHFRKGILFDCIVDELGTGTMAFHSRCLPLAPAQWQHPNQSDLMVMLECVRREIPRVVVRREADFLRPITERQDDSLYVRSLKDDSVQTRLLSEAMASYPGRWCQSDG